VPVEKGKKKDEEEKKGTQRALKKKRPGWGHVVVLRKLNNPSSDVVHERNSEKAC